MSRRPKTARQAVRSDGGACAWAGRSCFTKPHGRKGRRRGGPARGRLRAPPVAIRVARAGDVRVRSGVVGQLRRCERLAARIERFARRHGGVRAQAAGDWIVRAGVKVAVAISGSRRLSVAASRIDDSALARCARRSVFKTSIRPFCKRQAIAAWRRLARAGGLSVSERLHRRGPSR